MIPQSPELRFVLIALAVVVAVLLTIWFDELDNRRK